MRGIGWKERHLFHLIIAFLNEKNLAVKKIQEDLAKIFEDFVSVVEGFFSTIIKSHPLRIRLIVLKLVITSVLYLVPAKSLAIAKIVRSQKRLGNTA